MRRRARCPFARMLSAGRVPGEANVEGLSRDCQRQIALRLSTYRARSANKQAYPALHSDQIACCGRRSNQGMSPSDTPGLTRRADRRRRHSFSIASTRKYYVQSCGNASTNLRQRLDQPAYARHHGELTIGVTGWRLENCADLGHISEIRWYKRVWGSPPRQGGSNARGAMRCLRDQGADGRVQMPGVRPYVCGARRIRRSAAARVLSNV
jgi:hypothetical protein